MQGKVKDFTLTVYQFRITPACAGKRQQHRKFIKLSQDHPCVCREKASATTSVNSLRGSPLRVQGKVSCSIAYLRASRITPACAGKSFAYEDRVSAVWDHPCVCREKYIRLPRLHRQGGSPLRVQGKATIYKQGSRNLRITPACAGKSILFAGLILGDQDHPCVCREKST